jgi:tetratricopeptide (TPR) repeat protein
VYPFENHGNEHYSWIASGIADILRNNLSEIDSIGVVGEDERLNLLSQIVQQFGDRGDFHNAKKIAELIGANLIVMGEYIYIGGDLQIEAKLLSAKDGNIIRQIELNGSADDIFDLQNEMTFMLFGEIESDNDNNIPAFSMNDADKSKISSIARPNLIAFQYYSLGREIRDSRPVEAIGYAEKALKEDPSYSEAFESAGWMQGYIFNRFDVAQDYIKTAVELTPSSRKRRLARLYKLAGDIYDFEGDIDSAIGNFNKSRVIMEELGLNETIDYASLMMSIGVGYAVKEDADNAIKFYEKSRAIMDSRSLEMTSGYAGLLMNFGTAYVIKEDYKNAMLFFDKSRSVFEAIGLDKTSGYSHLLYNLAFSHRQLGNKQTAGKYYRMAHTIYSSVGEENWAQTALNQAKRLGY